MNKIQTNSRRKFILIAALACALVGFSFAFALENPYNLPLPPEPLRIRPIPESFGGTHPPPSGYSSKPPTFSLRPTPPPDPKLKNFQIDLDLLDFADRNPLPKEHCFFPVKGRKDVVEYMPPHDEMYDAAAGIFNFPTGKCELHTEKCYRGVKFGYLPGMKKSDPPLQLAGEETSYFGNAVIPYRYVDDIDFGKCMPSWKGTLEVNDYQNTYNLVRLYEPPKRDYTKQSCYHPFIGYPGKRIFCDAEKCQLTENQYCENKNNGQCYLNGYPLKNKRGKAVTTFLSTVNWDWCLDEKGAIIPDDGGPPYEERFKPSCSYNIEAANYHEKRYINDTNFLIHCDENRCWHNELDFDMKKKEYLIPIGRDKKIYSKTPQLQEFKTINWQCLDPTKVRDYNKKFLCTIISSDQKNPDCRLCYENKKFVYKGCRVPYDALGRRTDIPESEKM